MKQTATNQFNDAMNLDLHPIVTPNSVLTDNLNGTFITYNGNEFCLQNDKGNTIKAFLTPGFVPIGIKEHNGVLYIVSYKEKTGESEIGTYPGVDWEKQKERWHQFPKDENGNYCYKPLHNLIKEVTYQQKPVKNIHCFMTTGGTYTWDSATRQLFSEQFGNFIEKLTHYLSYSQINDFLDNPTWSDGWSQEFKDFLLSGGTYNKYGLPAVTVIDNQIYFSKLFLGDSSDLVEFNNWYETVLINVINTVKEDETIANLITKYGLVKKHYYSLFSFKGLTFSYDDSEEASSEWDETELQTVFNAIKDALEGNQVCHIKVLDSTVSTGKINWDETSFTDLRTTKFKFDLTKPVTIEVQDSYDGSVNLILVDDKNAPRIINTEFSVNGDQYKLIRRNERDYLYDALFDTGTGLIKNPVSFAYFVLDSIRTGGQLKGGNYTFYAKLGDADDNQSDIIAESSIVSVYKGNIDKPNTISGTLAEERTDKIINLKLCNINEGYSKVYLYYTREYSDTQGFLMEESVMLKEPYDVIESDGIYTCNILFTGFETTEKISIEDLNIAYHTIDSSKAITQQQDMLFLGNIGNVSYDYSKFGDLAKLIRTSLSCSNPDEESGFDYINSVGSTYTGDGEYYNIHNIYSKVGYWPNEYYRFGVVFILADGKSSPVFNMNGGEVGFGEGVSTFTDSYANNYGVFHTPAETENTMIIETSSIIPWHFKFDCTDMVAAILTQFDNSGIRYADIIKGYYIVRQKRIPEVLTQGLHIPVDYYSHTPIVLWQAYDDDNHIKFTGPAIESFVDDDLLLKYRAETIDGGMIKPTEPYTRAVQIVLNYYNTPSAAAQILTQLIGITLVGLPLLLPALAASPVKKSETVFAYIRFDENGIFQSVEGIYESNFRNIPVLNRNGTRSVWYDSYNYSDGSGSSNPWILETPKNRRGLKYLFLTDATWNAEKQKALTYNTPNNLKDLIISWYPKDPDYQDLADAQYFFGRHLIETNLAESTSGVLSVEAMLNPNIKNRLDGSSIDYEVVRKCSASAVGSEGSIGISGRHQWMQKYDYYNGTNTTVNAVYVNSNNIGKSVGNHVYATVVGNASSASDLITISTQGSDIHRNVVRGRFAPFIGVDIAFDRDENDPLGMEIVQLAKRESNITAAVLVRQQDNSPYYVVSERKPILSDPITHVYRGDCFVVSETVRMITNFIDPNYPITENIIDEEAWKKWYLMGDDGRSDSSSSGDSENDSSTSINDTRWDNINTTDVNTVSLGHWITFKCLASSNIGLRSEDPFDTISANIMGNPRSFYPLSSNTATAGKQQDSELFNSGYGITVGQTRHIGYVKVPYTKQEYSNRIVFSNKHVTDAFVNGYRIFQGLSYQDYDKQYGPIVKLESWGNNILCVFEHGIAMLPVNEKALMQTTTEQTIHIYGHGVLPDQMSIISQDYGTRYAETVIRTPIGIYGIDTDAKKIWRFSDKQGFETLSDMKIESFLNHNLDSLYDVEMSVSDIRTHYNSKKGDVMFTWYRPETKTKKGRYCSICFNERQSVWTTRYDWLPIVSENINGEFYSLQQGLDENIVDGVVVGGIGIYDHDPVQSSPTRWYGKQHPFEFEFVVSDPIGMHKIYENLQIISNNVQPEELQFEFIGDSYMFNKERIYHSTKLGTFDEERVLKANYNNTSSTEDPNITDGSSDKFRMPSKTGVVRQQDEDGYRPFRNASILKDRDYAPNMGRIEKTENATNQYHLVIPQECRNIESWGRRLGNMHYKADSWYTTIEPILYDARLNDPQWTKFKGEVTKWNSARIRDKWCKIRVRYSGEDLAVITAIKTMLNV